MYKKIQRISFFITKPNTNHNEKTHLSIRSAFSSRNVSELVLEGWHVADRDHADKGSAATTAEFYSGLGVPRECFKTIKGTQYEYPTVAVSNSDGTNVDNVYTAEYNFLEALNLYEILGYKRYIAGTYSNLGLLAECATNDIKKAITLTLQGVSIIRLTSDSTYLSAILSNLAYYYSLGGDLDLALYYGNESLYISEDSGRSRATGSSLMELGAILIKREDWASALLTFERIITIESFLEGDKIKLLYGQLSKVCNDLKLYEKGCKYLWKLNVAQKEWDYKTNQALLYHQKRLETESREQEKKLLQLELEKKETELANSAIHLATQTELLGTFRDKLRHIVREIDEPIAALKKIKEELKTLPCESVDWAKFEQQYISVHPEFRAKLIEKYPDLTKQEVKMCQLARLGLKNYEMAQLLCLSERSVESHRYNLRKKLGLKTEENLMKFLGEMRG